MPTPHRHDCAVAFCCDRNYFHLALFMVRQIAFHNPNRRFDFVISSPDDLTLPDWAKSYDVVLHRAGPLLAEAEAALSMPSLKRFLGSLVTLLRLAIARELGDRYRRILLIDCDIFVEGGDVSRLLELDLGPHPLAAALDAPFLYHRYYHAKEYQRADLPALPYANAGVQVIDTKAYREQEVELRSFAICRTHTQAIIYTDQSMTNLALQGKFAQLAPCWNWQSNLRLPLVPLTYPVFFRHFIGSAKPDRRSTRDIDARFNNAYREFLTQFMPELLPKLAPPCPPEPLKLSELRKIIFEHVLALRPMTKALELHPDPYVALI